jgi:uncharacterized protein
MFAFLEIYSIIANMIERRLIHELKYLAKIFPATVLLGPRQVGKTTLARTYAKTIPGAVYLDLESDTDRRKLNNPEEYLAHHHDTLVILDEVQRMPNIFTTLRSVIDTDLPRGRNNGQFLFLGSASLDLLRQADESLAGRVAHTELFPLDLLEVSDTSTNVLWVRGGYPASYLAHTDIASADLRSNLIATYLERDIPQLGFRIPAETLRRFFTMLAHLQGSILNVASLARSLGVDGKTIAHYIDLFTDLMLVRRLSAWHANIGKRLVKSPKLYIRDSGILHALLGIRTYDTLAGHPIYGLSWEGFVVEQLLATLPHFGVEATYYRASTGDEIDLVVTIPNKACLAIEIKASETPHHSAGFLRGAEVVGATHRFVVYRGSERFALNNRVEAIGVGELMHTVQKLCAQH